MEQAVANDHHPLQPSLQDSASLREDLHPKQAVESMPQAPAVEGPTLERPQGVPLDAMQRAFPDRRKVQVVAVPTVVQTLAEGHQILVEVHQILAEVHQIRVVDLLEVPAGMN